MDVEFRDTRTGETLSDYIRFLPNELPVDAVGMWQILSSGRLGFGLEGELLVHFVRRCVGDLLARGAVPVLNSSSESRSEEWLIQPHYGATPEETLENVIDGWISRGAKDEDPGGSWFALPCLIWPHLYPEEEIDPWSIMATAPTRLITPDEFDQMLMDISVGSEETATPSTYRGIWYARQDGSMVGLRIRNKYGKALDLIHNNDPRVTRGFKVLEIWQDPRHRHTGQTFDNFIDDIAGSLSEEAVGFSRIVAEGRSGFGLEGDDLQDYVRECLTILLVRGAVPVIRDRPRSLWVRQRHYGSTLEAVVEGIIREWHAEGAGRGDLNGLWFALREHAWEPPT